MRETPAFGPELVQQLLQLAVVVLGVTRYADQVLELQRVHLGADRQHDLVYVSHG